MRLRLPRWRGATCILVATLLGTGCDPVGPPEIPRLHLDFTYAGAESGSFEVVAERFPPFWGLMLSDGPVAYGELAPGGNLTLQAIDPGHEERGALLTLHLGGGAAPGTMPVLPADAGPLSSPSLLQLGLGTFPVHDIFRLIEGEATIHRLENDWIEGTFHGRFEHLDERGRVVELAGGTFSLPVLQLSR